jgi:hypothetical protein
MSGQFKISLFLLVGMAISLSACNAISSREPSPLPTLLPSSHPTQTPAAQNTPTKLKVRQAQQTLPKAENKDTNLKKAENPNTQAERANYQAVPLDRITKSQALKGSEPKAMALLAFGDIESRSRDVQVEQPQPNQAIVTITQTGVADDSVRGIKYRAEFTPTDESAPTSKQWKMVWAGSQYQCQVGRGHQDWSTEKCR